MFTQSHKGHRGTAGLWDSEEGAEIREGEQPCSHRATKGTEEQPGYGIPKRARRFVRRNSRVHTEPQSTQRGGAATKGAGPRKTREVTKGTEEQPVYGIPIRGKSPRSSQSLFRVLREFRGQGFPGSFLCSCWFPFPRLRAFCTVCAFCVMAFGFMMLDRITGLTGTYRILAGGKRTVDGKTDDGGRMTVVMSVGGPSTGSGRGGFCRRGRGDS